ncbi:MAG: glycosyl transferase family 2 protein [Pseudonocardiales bacterium]|nr:glycosyl transferase family 2 protein [Pseudonocardiales bacterium]
MTSVAAVEPVVDAPVSPAARSGDIRPAMVLDLELSRPVTSITCYSTDGTRYSAAWLVVRIFGEPVGLVAIEFTSDRLSAAVISRAVEEQCGDLVRTRVSACGGDAESVLAGHGAVPTGEPGFQVDQQRWLADGPELTVVICTRNRCDDLARALDSLQRQTYRRFGILVVDNAPSDDRTAALVARLAGNGGPRIDYTVEPRPGLSWARNHALARVNAPVVVWLDDDEVADENWLVEIAGAFCANPGIVAVSGSVVPAELETQAQLWFEQYGGHTKGRGFDPAEFNGRDAGGQSPIYPLPAFGAGANMAFDVAALRAIGGFDNALGAGTRTLGGEDTLAFSQVLLSGGTVVYRPSALTRHYHRADYDSLARQMAGYGIGLTAYYSSLLRHDWRLFFPLIRLAPKALRDTFGRNGNGLASVPASFPRELLRLKTRGMLKGPFVYVRASRQARVLAEGRS